VNLRSLKSIVNWGVGQELLPEKNPFSRIKLLKVAEKQIAFLTKEQFKLIYESETCQTFKDIYLYAILSGIRLGSILNTQWQHINFEDKTVVVGNEEDGSYLTKSGKSQLLPLHPNLVAMLQRRQKELGRGCKYVFANTRGVFATKLSLVYISHSFKNRVRSLKLPESIHFHSLRASYGSWLAKAGTNIFEIQKLMGHSSPMITARHYAHLQASELHTHVDRLTL
jgi:integrase